jgi:hypothetical protein
VNPIPLDLIVGPFPDIRVAEDSFPDSEALLFAIQKFTVVYFAISPRKNAFAICFIVFKHADILAAICKLLEAAAVAMFVGPFTLVNPATSIDKHAKTVTLLSLQLAFEKAVPISFDSEVLLIFKLVVFEKLREHLVIVCVLLMIEVSDSFFLVI